VLALLVIGCIRLISWVSFSESHSAGHADVDAANQVMVIYEANRVKPPIVKRRGRAWFPEEQYTPVNAPSPRNLLVPAGGSRKSAIGSDGHDLNLI
jgi:hypothetical protein